MYGRTTMYGRTVYGRFANRPYKHRNPYGRIVYGRFANRPHPTQTEAEE